MEYSPWAKINKSPKEKQALIDAPPPKLSDEDRKLFKSSYNKESVDKEINRSKQKIGSSEAKAIHGLLKGRHAKGGSISTAEHSNPKHKHCW
jgi:hypothetical protein